MLRRASTPSSRSLMVVWISSWRMLEFRGLRVPCSMVRWTTIERWWPPTWIAHITVLVLLAFIGDARRRKEPIRMVRSSRTLPQEALLPPHLSVAISSTFLSYKLPTMLQRPESFISSSHWPLSGFNLPEQIPSRQDTWQRRFLILCLRRRRYVQTRVELRSSIQGYLERQDPHGT